MRPLSPGNTGGTTLVMRLSPMILGVMAASMSPVAAEAPQAYDCQWTSEVTPGAVIRFDRFTGIGGTSGRLLFDGTPVGPFSESTTQGYANRYWSMDQGGEGTVLHLRGDRLVRSLLNPSRSELAQEPPRVILVGLGRHLWYRGDQRWRDQPELIAAAEGFWRVGAGCRQGP